MLFLYRMYLRVLHTFGIKSNEDELEDFEVEV